MYYLIEESLKEVTKEEFEKSRKIRIALLDRKEWKKEKNDLPLSKEIGNEQDEMLTSKANVNYDSLSGTFSIPDRNDMDREEFRFAYAMNQKNVVIVDDSGYAKNALEEISRTKKWNNPCLERFLYDFLDGIKCIICVHD